MIHRLFTEHPRSVDESYLQHLAVALSFSVRLALAALACLVHAILPFLFVKTGSAMISALHDRMVTNRHRRPVGAPAGAREGDEVPVARL
ncbi:MAG: DUF6356 family protein [Kiloniellales bacterium]|nr:DUF6356 family protein [Kiloniellales bacterium]